MNARNFHHKPAVREATPLLVGLTGPSGSGKTKSALRLATGIVSVRGGRVAFVDTEANRGLHYAPPPGEKADIAKGTYDFDHIPFSPPFGSDDYAAVLEYAAGVAKGGCVVIDSMSHEHEGEGGYLEFHEKELDRMAGDDYKKRERVTFGAWIKPAAARRRLINKILQINCSFVFCFRAKEKLRIVRGKDPEPLGWQAIAGEEFVYEMTSRLLLPPGASGVPSFDKSAFEHNAAKMQEQHRDMFVDGQRLDEEVGEKLARWAAGSKPVITKITFEQAQELQKLQAESTLTLEQLLKVAKVESLLDMESTDFEGAKAYLTKRRKTV